MNFIYLPNDSESRKTRAFMLGQLPRAVTFMKFLASLVSLIFLPKTLVWIKIRLLASKLLNLAELVANEFTRRISKNFTNILNSLRLISA